jgi:D-tagatose-1,6-bisphosphate aldolase subunit GatZ/KbaZ
MPSLQDLIACNRQGERVGTYAVCSAHSAVIDAAIHQALADGSFLHVESTSSQVNQNGGYTGQTPQQFADHVYAVAQHAGLSRPRVLLGGDHLGPYPWRAEAANQAMAKACELVRACVLAGYRKIHLDASMACADDSGGLGEETIASRAALLCHAAETANDELPRTLPPLLYVIGSEVPAPGGESDSGGRPAVTSAENVHCTLRIFQRAFAQQGLSPAWERVIAVVVQPGVDFGDKVIFDYDRSQTQTLSAALPAGRSVAYEAHSTDYQTANALAQMVEDHFAVLKVGPWLTFAYREAIFGLSSIEQELLGRRKGYRLSQVRDALETAMLQNPVHWRAYYQSAEDEQWLARAFSYSDRCRYYWHESSVEDEVRRLFANLSAIAMPLPLISQYLPAEYRAVRAGQLKDRPEMLIQNHIRKVLRHYAYACSLASN